MHSTVENTRNIAYNLSGWREDDGEICLVYRKDQKVASNDIQNYHVRNPTVDEVEAVTEMIIACEIAESGEQDTTLEDMQDAWQEEGFDLQQDAWVVTTREGTIVAYGKVTQDEHGQLDEMVFTHPEHCGHGLGTELLQRAEKRARELTSNVPEGTRVVLRNVINAANKEAGSLLRHEGYSLLRHQLGMAIDMEEEPPAPQWPEGIVVRTMVPGQDDHAVYDTLETAFQDMWGITRRSFDVWANATIRKADFDPTLCFLAWDGERLAGASLCTIFLGMGFVQRLGVLREDRRRGLGMALLLHSFGEFYRRGYKKVALGVDAESLTGALRLYERAGMYVELQFDKYEKELRTGKDLRNLGQGDTL